MHRGCVRQRGIKRGTAGVQRDEARHEAAYQKIVEELIRRDPDSAVLAFADMMQASIVMPAHLMQDGGAGLDARMEREEAAYGAAVARRTHGGAAAQPQESDFFKGFAAVADGLGVYTAGDYAACVEHLLWRWKIADLQVRTAPPGPCAGSPMRPLRPGTCPLMNDSRRLTKNTV